MGKHESFEGCQATFLSDIATDEQSAKAEIFLPGGFFYKAEYKNLEGKQLLDKYSWSSLNAKEREAVMHELIATLNSEQISSECTRDILLIFHVKKIQPPSAQPLVYI